MRQLDYKSRWSGRIFVQLERWFPGSKTCSDCGHKVDKLPLSIREWDCPACGAHHDRDENAAKNHLAVRETLRSKGLSVLACGANVRPEKQSLGRQVLRSRHSQK